MLVMVSAPVPELVSVTVWAALVVFRFWLPKLRVVGAMLMLAGTPAPDRATVCGLPVALSVTEIVPGWLPVAVGVNVTLMEQWAPAAREAGQVLVWEYGALAAMLAMFSVAAPELVSVTDFAALV